MRPIFKALYFAISLACGIGLFISSFVVIFNWGQSYNHDNLMKEAERREHAEYCLETNQIEWKGECQEEEENVEISDAPQGS